MTKAFYFSEKGIYKVFQICVRERIIGNSIIANLVSEENLAIDLYIAIIEETSLPLIQFSSNGGCVTF